MSGSLLLLSMLGLSWQTAPANPPTVARSEVELGPVKLIVEMEPPSPRLSDEPKLTLTVTSEDGVIVHLPPFGESLGQFTIRDFETPMPTAEDGRRTQQQIYRLEPMATGRHSILPIPITFEDLRPQGDGKTHTIESEALSIEVTSMLEGSVPRLSDLKPPQSAKLLPRAFSLLAWILGAAAVLVLATIAFLLLRKRRVGGALLPLLSPMELAHQELAALLRDDPLGRGDVKRFYVELTAIVRRYIERTTPLRAPELTTPEFLRAMRNSNSNAFAPEDRAKLAAFLESADLVKFAALEPSSQDIELAFERAKAFVGLVGSKTSTEAA